jgi:hypothetical protein
MAASARRDPFPGSLTSDRPGELEDGDRARFQHTQELRHVTVLETRRHVLQHDR